MAATALRDDPIRHVVLLILENHSFDQMLGAAKALHPNLDGVDPAHARINRDDRGGLYRQALTTERQMLLDPCHDLECVERQLENGNAGFVLDFARSYPESSAEARGFVMGYYPLGFLPALHGLARDFTICDHWFSSLPGPTWPNRFFALSGTSSGRVDMPHDGSHGLDLAGWFEQTQPTLFDRLNEQAIHWKVYFHDIPQSSVLCRQRLPHNVARYFYIDDFFADAHGAESDFPQFSLIEPDYLGINENDDHPPHDIMKAEKLLADVYNALRANGPLWESTLLVVFYDEHGGFYDHVEPPAATPPDAHREDYGFDRLGVRVPALLVSPWVERRVEPTRFDHTSLLKYLIEKWGLGPLGARAAAASSIAVALTRKSPRPSGDMISRIELTAEQLSAPDPVAEEAAFGAVNAHQAALLTFGDYLRIATVETLPRLVAALARGFEALKRVIEMALGRLYREPKDLPVSITDLDRLAAVRDAATARKLALREDFGRFVAHQKRRAVPELARMIRDGSLSEARRAHAAHALAMISGRGFHRAPDRVAQAQAWLARHRR
ncbi:MAG TPA: alkaline phosphatase family protein [Alphaproteobacteria bacterium]|nr:alkaline phosphatase family protein [Alphaproteobacteria bacterium]